MAGQMEPDTVRTGREIFEYAGGPGEWIIAIATTVEHLLAGDNFSPETDLFH